MYKKLEDIPLHVFTNKECTITPSKELRDYLSFMLEHHVDDLQYLHKYTQTFTKYGGCYMLSFDRWVEKLRRDLIKQEGE